MTSSNFVATQQNKQAYLVFAAPKFVFVLA